MLIRTADAINPDWALDCHELSHFTFSCLECPIDRGTNSHLLTLRRLASFGGNFFFHFSLCFIRLRDTFAN